MCCMLTTLVLLGPRLAILVRDGIIHKMGSPKEVPCPLTAKVIDVRETYAWALPGLVLAQSTNYTDAVAVSAVSPKPVPIGVTTVEQFAIGFINIAVPSSAGRIATNARFFGKFGMGAVTAMTVGAITGVISILAQAILVVLTIVVGKAANTVALSAR